MAYTPKTIHSGDRAGGYSTKNAQDLAVVLEDIDTAIAAAGDITALTDSSGGTADNTVAAVSGSGADTAINNNFADLAAKINAIIAALAG